MRQKISISLSPSPSSYTSHHTTSHIHSSDDNLDVVSDLGLTTLSLRINALDDAAATALAHELANNTMLAQLSVWGNHITDEGGIALAKVRVCCVVLWCVCVCVCVV